MSDSDYLELLAHWFDRMDSMGKFENDSKEVQNMLRRIALKLRKIEFDEYSDISQWQ